jgi:hypothetical protein
MEITNRWLLSALSTAVIFGSGLTGCSPKSGNPEYVLEQTSTRSLEDEANRALEYVHRARQRHVSTEDDVAEALAAAEKSLVHLSGYYLPLVEARSRAYNAYTFSQTGQQDRATEELVVIEQVLLRIANGKVAQAENLVRKPAEKLAEAKIALSAGDADAPRLIGELASMLNHEILKGPIELGGE